jgi:large subunit ribosomal protein L11
MATESIKVLVEGGKATAAPPLGPALGPLGVNIGQVVSSINQKTADFKGMQVPVEVKINKETKEFDIEIGTPPASALLKKEADIKKGSGNPKDDKVADVLIEQIIKISKMKETNLLGKNTKSRVKEIIGTCNSMGILVEGKPAFEAIKEVNKGTFDEKIKTGKTELSAEEMKKLEEEKKKLAAEMESRRAEFEKTAKTIIESMKGKTRSAIKTKLKDTKIPDAIIKELLPVEDEAKDGDKAKEGDAKKPEPAAKK